MIVFGDNDFRSIRLQSTIHGGQFLGLNLRGWQGTRTRWTINRISRFLGSFGKSCIRIFESHSGTGISLIAIEWHSKYLNTIRRSTIYEQIIGLRTSAGLGLPVDLEFGQDRGQALAPEPDRPERVTHAR